MPRSSRPLENPWGLTRAEARTMDAICTLGTAKLCAKALGISHRTVEFHQKAIKKKMPFPLIVRSSMWYGWRNGVEWKGYV